MLIDLYTAHSLTYAAPGFLDSITSPHLFPSVASTTSPLSKFGRHLRRAV